MTRTTTTASLLLAATFALATQAFAQAPSEAQREAIKSNCRSDYIAHCSSIPPGGAASLECLQKNMSSLSASCAGAVRAVEAPAAAPKTAEEPKSEPKAENKGRAEGSCAGCQGSGKARCRTKSSEHQEAEPGSGLRDQERLPIRLSQGLRGCADRRRAGAGMPGKEQSQGLRGLRQGSCRSGWRCRSGSSRRRRQQRRCTGCHRRACFDRARAASDAAARTAVRAALGLRRRRPHAVRGRPCRRRADRAMSRHAGSGAVTSLQGRAEPVRAIAYDPEKCAAVFLATNAERVCAEIMRKQRG